MLNVHAQSTSDWSQQIGLNALHNVGAQVASTCSQTQKWHKPRSITGSSGLWPGLLLLGCFNVTHSTHKAKMFRVFAGIAMSLCHCVLWFWDWSVELETCCNVMKLCVFNPSVRCTVTVVSDARVCAQNTERFCEVFDKRS